MRKFTLVIAMIIASFYLLAVDMTGIYKVGSTSGADFSTLSAAITAVNSATITGDIVLEITSNITEPANFGLAKDFGTFSLTIRPDADADRTITFTQATANVGPYGHFVIGCATENLGVALSDATVLNTKNVIIDGYAVAGTTRRLKFETADAALAGSAIFNILGASTNVVIKNCTINNLSSGSSPMGIYVVQFKGTTKDVSPLNIEIVNNVISARNQTVSGYGIRCNKSGSPTTRITELGIKDNIITASGTGIEVYYCNGVNIKYNEIKIQKGATTGSGIGVWLRGSTGDMYVHGNRFTELSSVQTGTSTYATQGILTGATSTNPFNCNIWNNTFSGMNRSVTGPAALNQTYIAEIGYGTTKIYHNTFYLPALTLPTQAGAYNAISFTTTNIKADVKNNIFISDEDVKSVLISKVITVGTVDNNIYYLRTGNTNARIVDTYATLAAYQTANPTLDINGKSVNVSFIDAAMGNLKLTGTSVQDVNLSVVRLAEVEIDMTGAGRATNTYVGAHHPANFINSALESTKISNKIMRTLHGVIIELDSESLVEVYNINGILIDKRIANGSYSRDLSNGLYLIRINGEANKFVK